MKKVMVQAWAIARAGQKAFGGNVKQYFAEALKMAWVIYKKAQKSEYKMVITGNKDARTNTIEFVENGKVLRTEEGLTGRDYQGVANDFIRRGAKVMEFYALEKGIKTFLGFKVVA